jgi:hypothetical protein
LHSLEYYPDVLETVYVAVESEMSKELHCTKRELGNQLYTTDLTANKNKVKKISLSKWRFFEYLTDCCQHSTNILFFFENGIEVLRSGLSYTTGLNLKTLNKQREISFSLFSSRLEALVLIQAEQ